MDWRWLAWQVFGGEAGRLAAACYDRLVESQWWESPLLQQYQRERLSQILEFAAREVPFYNSLADRQSQLSLADLPVLGRQELGRLGSSLQPAAASHTHLHRASSSGSTGEPVTVVYDMESAAWRHAAALRADPWGTNLQSSARQVALWGNSRDLAPRPAWLEALSAFYRNRYLLNCFVMDEESVRHVHARIRQLKPALIYGYVSALSAFASISERLGLAAPIVEKVIPTAEHCSPQTQVQLQDFFGCPVLGRYGSREIGTMAHQCELGTWHWHSENFVVEVQSSDGAINGSGKGHLLCTTLSNRAMPLLRYDIGDIVDLTPVPCNCGRGLPTFSSIEGRVAEHISIPDGRLISSLAYTNFLRQLKLERFRIIQDAPDHLELQLQGLQELTSDMRRNLLADFASLHGEQIRVDLRLVESIEPLPSGKNPHVINLVSRR